MSGSRKISFRQFGLALLSGILLFGSFSLPGGVSLFPLAWVALVPLLIAVRQAAPRRAFLLGFLAGFTGCFGIYYWIPYCMINYADMSRPLAYLALFLLVLILAGYPALFTWLWAVFQRRSALPAVIIGPLLWVSLEYIRTYFPLGGFPWALLGNSQYKFLQSIQVAELGGVYLVSWLVALVNFGIAGVLQKTPAGQRAWKGLVLAAACFAAAVVYGQVRMKQVDAAFAQKPELKVGIVQGNIDQGEKWNSQLFWASMVRHIELSKDLLREPKDLLIWPEAAVTDYFNLAWQDQDQIAKSLSGFDAYFLFGAVSKKQTGEQKQYFNSAYMLSPNGEKLLGQYDKIHLVPFGEYVPLKKLLFWVDAIAGGNTGDTDPGDKVLVFDTGSYRIGCVICYEVIFPGLVRKFVKAGAQVMSTVTNDAWFGPTSAPHQHYSTMIFRAVENRVYFIRAANTGISGVCDPCGRTIAQSQIYEVAQLEAGVKRSSLRTLYTRLGDWFALSCLGLTLAALAFILINGGKNADR